MSLLNLFDITVNSNGWYINHRLGLAEDIVAWVRTSLYP